MCIPIQKGKLTQKFFIFSIGAGKINFFESYLKTKKKLTLPLQLRSTSVGMRRLERPTPTSRT